MESVELFVADVQVFLDAHGCEVEGSECDFKEQCEVRIVRIVFSHGWERLLTLVGSNHVVFNDDHADVMIHVNQKGEGFPSPESQSIMSGFDESWQTGLSVSSARISIA